MTRDNAIDYVVRFDEFEYKANKWDYPRRVIVKVEKPYNQLTNQYSFIVANMNLNPENILKYYRNRAQWRISSKTAKASLIFRPHQAELKLSMQIDTIRLKLIKVASKILKVARYLLFKLCSSCPYKNEYYTILENIRQLPQLE